MHLLQPSRLLPCLAWLCLRQFHEALHLIMRLPQARRQLTVMRLILLLSRLHLKCHHLPAHTHLKCLQQEFLAHMLQVLVLFPRHRADRPRLDLLPADHLQQQDLDQERRSRNRKRLLRHPNIVGFALI